MENAFKWHIYSLAAGDWYESPSRIPASDELTEVVKQRLDDWHFIRRDVHIHARPDHISASGQGWKIHCSATEASAVEVLSRAADVCGQLGASFKFVASLELLAQVNGRAWPRAASGKFITIYPRDDEHFVRLLDELHGQLKDLDGPYILSDRRYKDCKALYYRYGSHELTYQLLPDGRKRPMLRRPDGQLEEEQRRPYWLVPPWTAEVISEQPGTSGSAGNQDGGDGLIGSRFRVEKAFAFSSEGGIYRAHDVETGDTCVLREARPHGVIDIAGLDAIGRLHRHHSLISRISEAEFAPRPIGIFHQWEHTFLAESYIEEIDTLFHYIVINNPLVQPPERADANVTYLRSCLDIALQLLSVQEVLDRNDIVYTDLSATNICIRGVTGDGDPQIVIVDFGSALDRSGDLLAEGIVETSVGFRRPGGMNLAEVHGFDSYAFGALLLSMLFPVTPIFDMAPETAERMARVFAAELDAPEPFVQAIISLLSGEESLSGESRQRIHDLLVDGRECLANRTKTQPPAEAGAHGDRPRLTSREPHSTGSAPMAYGSATFREAITKLNSYVIDAADPERTDRLFPADPSVFETNPLSVAFGSAGVMYALGATGADIPAGLRAAHTRLLTTRDELPPGLYTGTAGVAWSSWTLGLQDQALELANGLCSPGEYQSWDVFTGAAGIGLALLRLYSWTSEQRFLDSAVQAGDATLRSGTPSPGTGWPTWTNATGSTVEAGYALGRSGIAEFLLHLWRETGDERFVKTGIQSLASVLDQGIQSGDRLSIPAERNYSGPIRSHYWYQGTAGAFSVAVKYRRILGEKVDDVLPMTTLASMSRDLTRRFTIYPSLLKGMAGIADSLLDGFVYLGERSYLDTAAEMAERLMTFAVPRGEGLAFPGEQLIRLTTDIASGNSGVVLFLDRLIACLAGQPAISHNFTLDARA